MVLNNINNYVGTSRYIQTKIEYIVKKIEFKI